jgi:hypothetical protein
MITRKSSKSSKSSHSSKTLFPITNPFLAQGGCGRRLYKCHVPAVWLVFILFIYTITAVEFLIWASRGPKISTYRRVLETGSLKVDQFYSGLVLSCLLIPVGIIVRQTSSEMARLHPFAMASRTPISIADFDRITEPGIFAVRIVSKYSPWRAVVQLLLLAAGWSIVPIGTLTVTTGIYAPQTESQGMIGVPTSTGLVSPLHIMMNQNLSMAPNRISNLSDFEPAFDATDHFLDLASTIFKGNLLSRTDQLRLIPQEVGAMPTLNFTFETGVRYSGMVTYTWEGNCEGAENDIKYSLVDGNGSKNINYVFPDQSVQQATLEKDNLSQATSMLMWTNATIWQDKTIPRDGITYYVVSLLANTSISNSFQPDGSGLVLDNGVWISRVKCNPSMTWRVAACTWDGTFMRNCTAAPGQNSTELDTTALNTLTKYMDAVPWRLYATQDILITRIPFTGFSPTVAHFNILNGIIGLSLATVSSMGSWGTATVQVIGQPPRQAYIARIEVLIIAVCVLASVALFTLADIVFNIITAVPFRKVTFLTIASAVRGSWWDSKMNGGCVLSSHHLRHSLEGDVMFGVDLDNCGHVGLAPETGPIDKESVYYGLRENI